MWLQAGIWGILPAGALGGRSFFPYHPHGKMPLYVTFKVEKILKAPRCADRDGIKVRMIGDGKPTTTRTFYLHPHPNPDPGAEHIFILNHPEVRFLKGTPPTF